MVVAVEIGMMMMAVAGASAADSVFTSGCKEEQSVGKRESR